MNTDDNVLCMCGYKHSDHTKTKVHEGMYIFQSFDIGARRQKLSIHQYKL